MNRRTLRYLLIGSIALGLGVSGTLVANAQWSIPGRAAAQVTTAVMPVGSTPTAKKHGFRIVVSWQAQVIAPGVRIPEYAVTARDTRVPPRPAVMHTVPASGADVESTTFTLAELGNGKWDWTVAPRYRLWSGADGPPSSPSIPVGGDQAATAPPVLAPDAKEVPRAPAALAAAVPPATTAMATVKTDATARTRMTPPTDPPVPGPAESSEPATTQGTEADPTATESPSVSP